MIRLTRSVVVSSFDAQATVAVGRDRPEFLAVARLAADLDRPIGGRDVLRELLGELPEVVGRLVIDRCVGLGLLERTDKQGDATLSEAGRIALDHGKVLVPEEGTWRFFVIDDPLVHSPLVHAVRLESERVQGERKLAKEAHMRGERLSQGERPPELLSRCVGAAPRQSVQDGRLFQLIELADRGATASRADARLEFTWTDTPSLRLTARRMLDDESATAKSIDAGMPLPAVLARWSRESLWRRLVTHATQVSEPELERWQSTTGKHVVPVPFSPTPAAARLSFRRDLDVPTSELDELGSFDATILKDVDLVPASGGDAQAWLEWLQWEVINDFVTPALLESTSGAQLARFPYHKPRVLSALDLLAKARVDRDERSWFLLAPSDLGLWS